MRPAFLRRASPSERETPSEPPTRPSTTRPPAASIRRRSLASSGLWSLVRLTAARTRLALDDAKGARVADVGHVAARRRHAAVDEEAGATGAAAPVARRRTARLGVARRKRRLQRLLDRGALAHAAQVLAEQRGQPLRDPVGALAAAVAVENRVEGARGREVVGYQGDVLVRVLSALGGGGGDARPKSCWRVARAGVGFAGRAGLCAFRGRLERVRERWRRHRRRRARRRGVKTRRREEIGVDRSRIGVSAPAAAPRRALHARAHAPHPIAHPQPQTQFKIAPDSPPLRRCRPYGRAALTCISPHHPIRRHSALFSSSWAHRASARPPRRRRQGPQGLRRRPQLRRRRAPSSARTLGNSATSRTSSCRATATQKPRVRVRHVHGVPRRRGRRRRDERPGVLRAQDHREHRAAARPRRRPGPGGGGGGGGGYGGGGGRGYDDRRRSPPRYDDRRRDNRYDDRYDRRRSPPRYDDRPRYEERRGGYDDDRRRDYDDRRGGYDDDRRRGYDDDRRRDDRDDRY